MWLRRRFPSLESVLNAEKDRIARSDGARIDEKAELRDVNDAQQKTHGIVKE